jgi:hypothetical protein
MATEVRHFSDELRADEDYLAYRQTLPSSTNADGNGGAQLVAKVQDALEIAVRAYADITLTGDLTIKLQESDTEGGTYADIAGASITLTNPAQLGGEEVARFGLNRNVKPWVKVNIATTAAATGSVNVYPAYVSR